MSNLDHGFHGFIEKQGVLTTLSVIPACGRQARAFVRGICGFNVQSEPQITRFEHRCHGFYISRNPNLRRPDFTPIIKNMELLYKELTEKIIQALFEVFNSLGPGLNEVIYKRAVEEELNNLKLEFQTEKNVPVYYKHKKIGFYRLDFLVEDQVILELKVKTEIEPLEEAQLITYLKATGYRVGILVSFGGKSLKFKRFIV